MKDDFGYIVVVRDLGDIKSTLQIALPWEVDLSDQHAVTVCFNWVIDFYPGWVPIGFSPDYVELEYDE